MSTTYKNFETLQINVVYIPGGVPHSYEALGDEAFEFLCVVPNLPDQTRILGDPGPDSAPAGGEDDDLVVPEDRLGC